MRNVSLRDAAQQRPLRLLLASKALGSSPTSVANCAAAGYEALLAIDTSAAPEADSRRFYALLGHFNGLLRRGETEQAVRAVEQFRTRWGQGRSLYLLAGPVVPVQADADACRQWRVCEKTPTRQTTPATESNSDQRGGSLRKATAAASD
jgi:hypothetical protein